MSAAIDAKSARARASIAARILKTQKSLWRPFDDCFEMGDGDEVHARLLKKAETDMRLLRSMLYVHTSVVGSWGEEVLQRIGKTRAEVYYA